MKFVDDVLYDYSPLIVDIDDELLKDIAQVEELLLSDDYYLGIAANQVGIRKRFFSFREEKGSSNVITCINPTFIGSGDVVTKQEICLSFPDRWNAETKEGLAETLRFDSIYAQWTDKEGCIITDNLKGVAALIYQHECDHLNGVTVYA